ncbi:MAG: 3-methyl-2-oxobutanoate hydroxymethyltransferase [Proteobacteria bacterium]|nr:3-methyl-2-oxobutanoate hydroxymethyltransferase [Pseudomonadota bacterium]
MKNKITLTKLREMKKAGDKIACLTAYDASFAALLDEAGIDVLLIGDSLGMVLQGEDNTLKVTVADMLYHTRLVSRAGRRPLIVSDMPFMSYATPAQALGNAARLMSDGGAEVIKIEGGENLLEVVQHLNRHDIPVCGHLGLQPQSVHKYGGYRVQGRQRQAAEQILQDAQRLQDAGIIMLVLECIPADLAANISSALDIPTIGIGAGLDCDGQVLVLYDMLGISARIPSMARNFLEGKASVQDAVRSYVEAVKAASFPAPEHSFK